MVTLVATIVAVSLTGCGDDAPDAGPATSTPDRPASPVTTTPTTTVATPDGANGSDGRGSTSPASTTSVVTSTTSPGDITHPELRDELLAMAREDQDERTGVSPENSDREHADRLAAIVERFGWPTRTMVGTDGGTAAWLIAQHADFDVDFQARMLRLLTAAADAGEASGGDLAYLTDRVAVNRGRPQTYGTQIGGCGPDGAKPGRIRDIAHVDERRADAGLSSLEEYLAEFTDMCESSG